MDASACTQWMQSRAPNGRECVHPMHVIMCTQCTQSHPPNARNCMHPMDANERSLALPRPLAGIAANAPWPCRSLSLASLRSLPGLPSLRAYLAFRTCAHVKGNRAPLFLWARCASIAPLDVYLYAFGGESCASRLKLTLVRSAAALYVSAFGISVGVRRAARGLGLARHSGFALGYPLATLGPHFVRRLSRSPSRRSRRLHGAARCSTSSAGYSLLVLRRAAPPNRRTAPPRVAPLDAQPSSALPHLDWFLCAWQRLQA